MSDAAKFFDPVLGIDIHLYNVPTPAPVPTPLPTPYIGIVFDAWASSGQPNVNGVPSANVMTDTKALPHIMVPPATPHPSDAKPSCDGFFITGSKTVRFGGASQSRSASSVMSCNYPVRLPMSAAVAGSNVIIGGPEAIDFEAAIEALKTRLMFAFGLKMLRGIGKRVAGFFKKGKGPKAPKPPRGKCTVTGHPVDVATGELIAEAVDFELGGAIMPVSWVRNYRSREGVHPTLPTLTKVLRARVPALGPAWFHPYESWIEEQDDGLLIDLRLPDGRTTTFDRLRRPGGEAWDPMNLLTLRRTAEGYELVEESGKRWVYRPLGAARPGAPRVLVPVSVLDSSENRIDLVYQRGYLTHVIDAAGRVLELKWNAQARVESVWFTGWVKPRIGALLPGEVPPWPTDLTPLDRPECLVRYGYENGQLTRVTDPLGASMTYRWRDGVIVEEVRKSGVTFHFAWDFDHPDGWCVRTWGENPLFDPSAAADNALPRLLYDRRIDYLRDKRLTIVEDGRGGVTQYFWNDVGVVEKEVGPVGGTTETTWTEDAWKLSVRDALGNETKWTYDERGRVLSETDALGRTTHYRYDAYGNRAECIDPAGGLTSFAFDHRRLPLSATSPAGDVTRYAFDARGRAVGVADPMGRTWSIEWTARHDVARTTDGEQRATTYHADAMGRLVGAVDPAGRRLCADRDAAGRVRYVERFDGERLSLTYDAEDNVVEQVDGQGRRVRMRYAGLGQLVEHIDPLGYRVRLRYDSETDLVAVQNQAGEDYTFELDVAGRVQKETTFSGHRRLYVYDKAGQVERVVSDHGRVTKIQRDAIGRILSTAMSGGERRAVLPKEEQTFAYDVLGRLVAARENDVSVGLERDVLGRIVGEEVGDVSIRSTYDRSGLRVRRETSLQHTSTYDHNKAGDLVGMSTSWSGALRAMGLPQAAMGAFEVRFARGRNGEEIARRLPGGVSSVWTRDAFGKPTEQRVVTGAGADRPGVDVMRKGYAWASPEQIATITDYDPASGTARAGTAYQYDPRGHLVRQLFSSGEVIDRASDPCGNLFRSADRSDRVYGKGGVLKKAGGTTYTFDGDGYLSEKVLSDGAKWAYSWSAAGRLREVTRPDGKKVSFAYDAFGRRVKKTFDGKVTEFVWDGNDLVHERTTDAASGEKAPLVTWLFEPGMFSPVAKIEGRRRYGVVSDHLGVPTALMTEAGKIAWQAQLDVYGVVREETPVGGAAAGETERTGNPWRYPGQYEDAETGLYYNRFRYYDPEIGRYVSEDPIGLAGGEALFAYVEQPNDWVDPLGLGPLLPGELDVGGYKELNDAGTPKDNLTPHHVPSDKYMQGKGIDGYTRNDGVSINMEHPHPGSGGRHRRTASYGPAPDLSRSPRKALAEEIRDLRKIYQQDGLYGKNVRTALRKIISENKRKFPKAFGC